MDSDKCTACGMLNDSHHRCDSDDVMDRIREQSDPDNPSDELRLAEGFNMLNDDYYG